MRDPTAPTPRRSTSPPAPVSISRRAASSSNNSRAPRGQGDQRRRMASFRQGLRIGIKIRTEERIQIQKRIKIQLLTLVQCSLTKVYFSYFHNPLKLPLYEILFMNLYLEQVIQNWFIIYSLISSLYTLLICVLMLYN